MDFLGVYYTLFFNHSAVIKEPTLITERWAQHFNELLKLPVNDNYMKMLLLKNLKGQW